MRRETKRLCEIVGLVGYALGGLAGQRLLHRLGIVRSDDTVLRRVKSRGCGTSQPKVRVLGVAGFTAGQVCTDGGSLLLREVEHRINLLGRLAGCFRDGRRPLLVKHRLVEMPYRDDLPKSTVGASCSFAM